MNRITLPAHIATIEISNICNAKCRWCTTGIQNRVCQEKPHYLTPERFEEGLDKLLELGWIAKDTTVGTFNWGEPLLNPHVDEIHRIIAKKGLGSYLSTNGSVYRKLSPEVIGNLQFLMISIPGMSQTSYDKIHRLDARRVQENIRRFAQDLAECGAIGKLWINFHVYQFNLDEIEEARDFAQKLCGGGSAFLTNTAYFADYKLCQQYLRRELDPQDLYDASSQLFMDFYEERKGEEEGYACPLWGDVVFDHEFNLVPCCRLTTNERLGNLFEDDPQRLLARREAYQECEACIASGQSWLIAAHPPAMEWYSRLSQRELQSEAALRAAQAQAARLQVEIDGIKTSRSWRLTKPLRETKAFANRTAMAILGMGKGERNR